MTAPTSVTQPDDLTVVIARTFDAPRALVWKAWTEPQHVAQWFGPTMMTVPESRADLRAGGAWRIVMRAPDGTDYPCKGVYREVKAPERIVSTIDVSEHPDSWFDAIDPGRDRSKGKPVYEVTWDIGFVDSGGKTTVTIKTLFASKAVRDMFARHGMADGWSQSLDKLDRLLARLRQRSAAL